MSAGVHGVNAQQDSERDILGGNVENIVGKTRISGNVTVNGNIGADANVTGSGNLNVKGSVKGTVDTEGDVEISGDVTSGASVKTSGNVTIDGKISGTLEAGGNVTVGAAVKTGANLKLTTPGTELTVQARISGGSVKVTASDTTVDVNGAMESGTIDISGENGRVNIGGNVESEASLKGRASVEIGENVKGEIDVSGSVTVSSNIESGATVRTKNTVSVEGTVTGTVEAGNDVTVGENVEAGGKVTLETPGTTLDIQGSINGDVSVTEKARINVGQVNPETPVSVNVNSSPLNSVNISVKNSVSGVNISLDNLGNKPNGIGKNPQGKAYGYLRIDVGNMTEANVDNGTIQFNVRKEWINQNNIDSGNVHLKRYHSQEWQTLSTEKIDENSTHLIFEAVTPGFSTFSITGTKTKGGTSGPNELPGLPTNVIIGIAVIILIIGVVFAARR